MSFEPDPTQRRGIVDDDLIVDRSMTPIAAQPAANMVVEPPLAQPVVGRPVVAQPVIVQAAPQQAFVEQPELVHRRVATASGRRLAFDSVIVGIIGVALTIVGLIAVTRAGVDGPMDQPVVKVLGYTHTATLGAIETAIGVCLLLCAAITARAGAIFFGLVLGVGGVVGAVQTDSFRRSLALQSGLAWLAVIAAAIVVVASLLVPRMTTSRTRVDSY